MKTYSEFMEALTIQQRLKRSIISRRVAARAARKRVKSMSKPPSAEKIKNAIKRQVRQKALALVDKAGVYKTASAGVKGKIEKKVDLKVKKIGGKLEKKLRPQVKKAMKDAYRERMGKNNPEL